MFLEQWYDGRGSLNGLKKLLEKICTFYLSGTEYHTEKYDGPFSMIQSIEYLESLLEHLSEEEVHDTPIKRHPSSYLRKEAIKHLLKEYEVSPNAQQDSEEGKIQDDDIEELQEEPIIKNIVEDSPHVTIAEDIEDLVYSQVCCNVDIFTKIPLEKSTEQHIPSDPI